MSDDALKLPIEFPGEDRVQLALTEVLKSLGAVERQILSTGAASEANAKRILALTQAFTDGHKTAGELRAELIALAGDVPKTAAALRSEAAAAAKELAAAEKKAADEAAALAEKQKLIDERARVMGASLDDATSRMDGLAESAVNVGHGLGLALGGAVALGAGTVALLRTIGEASAGAELHQRALASLGGSYDLVQRATNGTISATDTYRARMALLNAGVRLSDRDFATMVRHAREHGDVMKSTAERVEELTDALRGGEAEGLQKFGITVDSTRSRSENLRSAIEQMTRAAGENAPATRTMGEEVTRFNESLTLGADALGAFADHALGARDMMRELGDAVRGVATDMLELIERENQLPAQRAASAARAQATQSYLDAQRGITSALTSQGFTEEQARGLVPGTALGRLSPEQIAAQARRLAGLRAQISALNAPANDNLRGRADVAEDLAGIAALGGRTAAPSLGAVDAGAALAGLRAARGGRSQRDVTQAQARALLEGVAREMISEAAANDAAARPAPPPRSTAPNQPGQGQRTLSPLRFGASEDIALARWAQEREQRVSRVGRGRAAEMGADEALTARELAETPAALARLRQLRDREARDREARLDDLRVSVAQAEQVVSLRREEERQSRPLFQVRQRAILAAQADVRHAQQMFALGVELDRAQDQRAQAQTIAETRLGGRVQRARGRTERAAEREDLRDPAVQRERMQDAREERALGRERAQLQDRLDREVTFTERMEDLHTRRAIAAREEAETVSHAFGAMGEAYADHLHAVIAGREDLGTALQGMLSDTLAAISKEAAIKAGLNLAEGFAALATYRYDAAAEHFAAAGIYTGVAVASGAAGAALAPAAAPAASGGGSERDRGTALDTGRGAANDNGRGGQTIIEQHYHAPIIGGRDATDAEVGRGQQRYIRAADRRRLGRTGTDG